MPPKGAKTQVGVEDSAAANLREWMNQNKTATWHEVHRQFHSINSPVLTGTVNASAGTWSKKTLEPPADAVSLSAMQIQPELFRTMSSMVTGRMPTQAETEQICASIQVHNAMPMR